MNNHPRKQNAEKVNLPQINHSKSVPLVPHNKKQTFNLRFVNEHMPPYDPNKDRFLHHFFQQKRQPKEPHQVLKERRSLKTLPSEVKQVRRSIKRQKLMTVESEAPVRQQGVKEISKQQFGNFMEMMKQKLEKR